MKLPRLITRRRMKRAGTTFAALIIIVFIVSGKYWGGVGWRPDGATRNREQIILARGQLQINDLTRLHGSEVENNLHWEFREVYYYRFDWGWEWDSRLAGRTIWRVLYIPLWFPLLLIAAPTAWLWRTDRRAKPWQCAKCRYDLRGLVGEDIEIGSGKWGTVCPECGTKSNA